MQALYIFHICTSASWEEQVESTYYRHESIASEGFIHCSEKHQIDGVLERYFAGVNNLLILTIEVSKVEASIKYEKAPNGDMFPHIYGPLNRDAIVKIEKLNQNNKQYK